MSDKPAHKNVYVALAAAQAEMEMVAKGAINPAFKGEGKPKGTPYADLADVVNAVKGPLTKYGIAFFHQFMPGDGQHIMRTVLVHGESETSIECDVPLIVAQNNMQGMKSATTYAKRIGLESVTGVAPEDDDGNAAASASPRHESRPSSRQEPPAPADMSAKADDMIAILKERGLALLQSQRFNADLNALRAADAQSAARVESEIETQKANADLGGDGIPY